MNETPLPHILRCEDRRQLVLTGVTQVERFDETCVQADTSAGSLTVRGSDLHVEVLSLETGDLTLRGQIDALLYEDPSPRGGVLSRLFR